MEKINLNGIRIAAIDYGLKRTGLAISDEFHVTSNPRKFIITDSNNFFDEVLLFLEFERAGAVVVGYPYRLDDKPTEVTKAIDLFIGKLNSAVEIPIFIHDESFSSISATETLLQIGKKKRKRSAKGQKDMIAAAIILRDFIETRVN